MIYIFSILQVIISQFVEYIPYFMFLIKAFYLYFYNYYFYSYQFLLFLLLIIFNVIINTLLKNIIQENRPLPTSQYGELQKHGMPSGHAQMTAFLFAYQIHKFDFTTNFILFLMLALSYYQRFIFNYHSFKQIIVGGIIGTFFGLLFS